MGLLSTLSFSLSLSLYLSLCVSLYLYLSWMLLTHCQDHILTENIWFVWSRTSYSGDKGRCYRCGTDVRTDDEQGKIELLSLWMLDAEFRNLLEYNNSLGVGQGLQNFCPHWGPPRSSLVQTIER